MDSRLYLAVVHGEVTEFLNLVNGNNGIIAGTISESNNTVLHIACRFSHVRLVTEMILLQPALIEAKNNELKTPLHEACCAGNLEILAMLLRVNPKAAYLLDINGESILLMASRHGKLDIVNHILTNYPQEAARLIGLEDDGSRTTSIHAATYGRHHAIVQKLLQKDSSLAQKKDSEGRAALHLASSNGHLQITQELLGQRDSDGLCLLQDKQGRTPLHWAAIKGHIKILEHILLKGLGSAEIVTKQGETILHLAVKNNQAHVVTYLMKNFDITNLMNAADNNGNTILHLATAAKLTEMLTFLVTKSDDVNSLNNKGLTPLDMVYNSVLPNDPVADKLTETLVKAGGKKSSQLSNNGTTMMGSRINCSEAAERFEPYNEGLLNTIIIVYVLVASATFIPVFNPPGGYYQQGILIGKPVLGRTAGYKVFMMFNNAALYSALGGVVILVSYLPFQRGPMMKLLIALAHKIMVVCLSFFAASHLAATWVTTHSAVRGTKWDSVAAMSVGGGTLLALVVAAGVIFLWHLKVKVQGRH